MSITKSISANLIRWEFNKKNINTIKLFLFIRVKLISYEICLKNNVSIYSINNISPRVTIMNPVENLMRIG
jgi:hypothetical protein